MLIRITCLAMLLVAGQRCSAEEEIPADEAPREARAILETASGRVDNNLDDEETDKMMDSIFENPDYLKQDASDFDDSIFERDPTAVGDDLSEPLVPLNPLKQDMDYTKQTFPEMDYASTYNKPYKPYTPYSPPSYGGYAPYKAKAKIVKPKVILPKGCYPCSGPNCSTIKGISQPVICIPGDIGDKGQKGDKGPTGAIGPKGDQGASIPAMSPWPWLLANAGVLVLQGIAFLCAVGVAVPALSIAAAALPPFSNDFRGNKPAANIVFLEDDQPPANPTVVIPQVAPRPAIRPQPEYEYLDVPDYSGGGDGGDSGTDDYDYQDTSDDSRERRRRQDRGYGYFERRSGLDSESPELRSSQQPLFRRTLNGLRRNMNTFRELPEDHLTLGKIANVLTSYWRGFWADKARGKGWGELQDNAKMMLHMIKDHVPEHEE